MVEKIKVTVLLEDSVGEREPLKKHGLALLVEVKSGEEETSLLMDTGPSAEAVLHNAGVLGVDLKKVDAILLSHGHYDHTGGLLGILKHLSREVPVVASPKAFGLKFRVKPKLRLNGALFKKSEAEAAGGMMLLARSPVTLDIATVDKRIRTICCL